MEHFHHNHDTSLIILSILIAIFASYTSLDLVNSVTSGKGRMKWLWLIGGSLAMGVGIWSMHFVGMLAFTVKGLDIYYDVTLLILSIVVAIVASSVALYIVSTLKPNVATYTTGSLIMGTAIAGMHYIGIWSMRMQADILWNWYLVAASIFIAFTASCCALYLAFRLRDDMSLRGFVSRGAGGAIMGVAISGMHYTGMAAMHLVPDSSRININQSDLLASDGLAATVIVGTMVILGIALSGSNVERALSRRQSINEALKESISMRDQFFSMASHELKTPLTSIMLQNDLILRQMKSETPDFTKMTTMLERTSANVNRLTRLVDDMLDISRMNSGKLTLQKEEFELSTLISEVIERLTPVLNQAKCEVRFVNENSVTGNWDRFRIEQVFVNILSNAAKYAPGTPVNIKIDKHQNSVIIKFRDHGKGIPDGDVEKIFNKFERSHHSDDVKGLGLGLFISREIVKMHDGDIRVINHLNSGAEFQVRLPLS